MAAWRSSACPDPGGLADRVHADDPITQRDSLKPIADFSKEGNIANVLVNHSAAIAARWADRTIELKNYSPN